METQICSILHGSILGFITADSASVVTEKLCSLGTLWLGLLFVCLGEQIKKKKKIKDEQCKVTKAEGKCNRSLVQVTPLKIY